MDLKPNGYKKRKKERLVTLMITMNGKTLFEGKVAATQYSSNWCSMSERTNPSVRVVYFETTAEPKFKTIYLDDEYAHCNSYQVTIDPEQAAMWKAHLAEAARKKAEAEAEEERLTVRRGKEVVVVSGRKIKIGTVGRCFWVGQTKFGWSCGMELADGSKVFTALHNVKVYEQQLNILGA
jgi:hypothetical protein